MIEQEREREDDFDASGASLESVRERVSGEKSEWTKGIVDKSGARWAGVLNAWNAGSAESLVG